MSAQSHARQKSAKCRPGSRQPASPKWNSASQATLRSRGAHAPPQSGGHCMSESIAPIVKMRGICKRYGGVQALAEADLDIYTGEVHALVGDNAAGKSTLVKT